MFGYTVCSVEGRSKQTGYRTDEDYAALLLRIIFGHSLAYASGTKNIMLMLLGERGNKKKYIKTSIQVLMVILSSDHEYEYC